MEKDFCKDFENKVLSQLNNLVGDIKALRIGVAVSGGADSISLLTALNSLCKAAAGPLFVITVNHFIRPAEETCGDAAYVQELCNKFKTEGTDLSFTLVELNPGQVEETAQERGGGIEEAARFLRYAAFETFIKENKLDYLCLAHNKNDQEETLLMRFLQGSGVDSSGGIAAKRGKYIRPLLEIERWEIEAYLTAQNISWRTDSTNLDTQYLRNKIRLELIPFLNEKFNGWQTGVLNGGKKACIDGAFISEEVERVFSNIKKDSISVSDFLKYPEAIQQRLLIKLCNLHHCSSRIPFAFLQDVLKEIKNQNNFSKNFSNVEISVVSGELFVKNVSKTQTDLVFFDIIEENGKKSFPFGLLEVKKEKESIILTFNDTSVQLNIDFPFCIRNVQMEDEIKCKDGNYKKVVDIFSDWHISEEKRCYIPVIQELKSEKQELMCIFGEPLGFYNWVVQK